MRAMVIEGDDTAEVLTGTSTDDSIFARGGNDTVYGLAGNDTIDAGTGNDLAYGGAGDDTVLYTVGGQTTLLGGIGTDTLVVRATDSSPLYFVVDGLGNVDDGQRSTLSGFERFQAIGAARDDFASLGEGADLFQGNAGADTAFGGAGDDELFGGLGDDHLHGGTGKDTLWGDRGNDMLYGDDGNDKLVGMQGADQLFGGAGRDTISGGPGNDTLTGGADRDVFLFTRNENGFDLITDFQTGVDRIHYWLLPWNHYGLEAGFLTDDHFSVGVSVGTHGQFLVSYNDTYDETWLYFDPNGASPAGGVYGIMRFSGDIEIAASDFYLYV